MSKSNNNTVDLDDIIGMPEDDSERGEAIATVIIKRLNLPRNGVKLAVIAVEGLICDVRTTEQERFGRPLLHTFLKRLYEDYDIILWSDGFMPEFEDKLNLLGVKEHPDYKLLGYVDKIMQPLQVIWSEFPTYNYKNTAMCDARAVRVWDTPNGIPVFPYTYLYGDTDNELLTLSAYMKSIAKCRNLSKVDHKKWRTSVLVPQEPKCCIL